MARALGADVYGVNRRDLSTLRLEPERALETLREGFGLRPLLAMSGIEGAREAKEVVRAGATSVLVGGALTGAADPRVLISDLSGLRVDGDS